ncbi:hypothetical protein FQN54_000622 [Arachnomyces sp. PD_36]|nr:hypothetical protein FQN54_000622 [Arachnomyces sp. PD_36]
MPIKLPKGFTRRKSSGNALDEVDNPPAPSFRVIERPDARRSVDGATALKQFNPRPLTTEDDDPHPENLFAGIKKPAPKNRYVPFSRLRYTLAGKLTTVSGSGGTNNSASTGLFDSSSSGRYSSSSTLPSSTDVPIHHTDTSVPHTRTYTDLPVPPIPESQPAFSLKAGGRTFSFGTRSPKPPMTPKEPSPPPQMPSRDRAMTSSTQSTATPPKLDSELTLGGESDGFGSMFENFGKRKSALFNSASAAPAVPKKDRGTPPIDPPQVPPQTFQRNKPLPSPSNLDPPKRHDTPSRYSWGSQNSQDGLMESNSREEENMFANPSQRSNVPRAAVNAGGLRRSVVYSGRRSSIPPEDDDAKLVMNSASVSRKPIRAPPVPEHRVQSSVDSSVPLFDTPTESSMQDWGNNATPRAPRVAPIRAVDEDASFAAHARLAAQYEESESNTNQPTNKVMTPAQFEQYRQQKELSRSQSDASKSQHSDDSDNYDEDDELEQKRVAAKQRQKQEAHLSVYRQQMMKVTGHNKSIDSTSSQNGLGADKANASSPNLLNRMSTLGIGPDKQIGGGKASDAEEDDDVPLGILAAHGFPQRNRPPGTLSSSNSNPNLRASVNPYPPPPASHAGEPRPNPYRASTLPVFAKNLPQDPYGLVHAPNRESLAMGGGSVHGGGGGAPGSLHPGGLIGVIANEERAKAMRRGSPNGRVNDIPGGMPMPQPQGPMNMGGGNMGPMGPMGGMPNMQQNPQMLSPGDQAQLQMSQQMTQMMQMQMQWMQQMMQAQGMQGGPTPEQMQQMNQMNQMGNGFLAPPGANGMRPMSMVSNGNGSPNPRQADQRTLSMLDPSMSSQFNNQNASTNRLSYIPPIQGVGNMNGGPNGPPQLRQTYAPSMAPSERSNVGMSPRYRPVSTVNPTANTQNRSSTFTSSTLRPWARKERQSSISSQTNAPQPSHHLKNSISNNLSPQPPHMTIRPVSSSSANANHGRGPSAGSMSGLNHPATRPSAEDDDEDDGWAEMAKKREKKKSSWRMKKGNNYNNENGGGLGDLYPAEVI